ncbi:MAG: glutamate 5-kinase [Tissierellia bacterium]|nr:glutamate 5-kinase [Tissierellia bacterium]
MKKDLKNIKRVVIKVGSSSITHENGTINIAKIADLAWNLSNLKNHGVEVVLVTSGAIAAGAKCMNLKERPKDTSEKQAASAVGQVALMNTYNKELKEFNYQVAQILLTKQIETDVVMRENAVNSFNELLKLNCIPIVNENDAICTFEIEFGDNDTLSAVVARLIDSDLLIMLSDIDGLYDSDPNKNPDAKLIRQVDKIDEDLFDMASGSTSNRGTGGMVTKLNAAMLCMERGIDVIIANGSDMGIIRRIFEGEDCGTLFKGADKC